MENYYVGLTGRVSPTTVLISYTPLLLNAFPAYRKKNKIAQLSLLSSSMHKKEEKIDKVVEKEEERYNTQLYNRPVKYDRVVDYLATK